MEHPVYDLAIAPLLRSLKNLDAILEKAEAFVAADETMEPATLIQARLYPNMRPLVFQVQVATEIAKGAAARLSGKPPPSWPDEEKTFADLDARVRKALDYIGGFAPKDFDGGEKRHIELTLRTETARVHGHRIYPQLRAAHLECLALHVT